MNKKTNFIVLLVALTFVGFMFADFFMAPFDNIAADADRVSTPTGDIALVEKTYADGEYSIAGFVELPTPCHSLAASVTVVQSDPEQVVIALTSEPGEDLCAQVITPQPFQVSFTAGENAVIRATLNNRPLTLITATQ